MIVWLSDAGTSLSAATPPWWAVGVLAGAFTVLGGLISFTAGYLSDRRKLAREDRRQWDSKILGLALEAMSTTEALSKLRRDTSESAEQIQARWAEKQLHIDRGFEFLKTLRFIAPETVSQSAEDMLTCAMNLGPDDTTEDLVLLRVAFINQVRAALRAA